MAEDNGAQEAVGNLTHTEIFDIVANVSKRIQTKLADKSITSIAKVMKVITLKTGELFKAQEGAMAQFVIVARGSIKSTEILHECKRLKPRVKLLKPFCSFQVIQNLCEYRIASNLKSFTYTAEEDTLLLHCTVEDLGKLFPAEPVRNLVRSWCLDAYKNKETIIDDIVHHDAASEVLLKHCHAAHNAEMFLFYRTAIEFVMSDNPAERKELTKAMWKDYIRESAENLVNTTSDIRESIRKTVDSLEADDKFEVPEDTFDSLIASVGNDLIQDVRPRFSLTSEFTTVLELLIPKTTQLLRVQSSTPGFIARFASRHSLKESESSVVSRSASMRKDSNNTATRNGSNSVVVSETCLVM